jgi:hypothetical protein
MDRRKAWIAISAFLIMSGLWASGSAGADLDMKEGKWETTSETVMEGMPYQMPVQKSTHCVTRKEMIPMSSEDRERCKILSQNVRGNTITYKMKCTDKEGIADIEGETTYADNGTSYRGNTSMKVTDKKGKATTMKMKVTGRRIGECDAPGKAREQAAAASAEKGPNPEPFLAMIPPLPKNSCYPTENEKRAYYDEAKSVEQKIQEELDRRQRESDAQAKETQKGLKAQAGKQPSGPIVMDQDKIGYAVTSQKKTMQERTQLQKTLDEKRVAMEKKFRDFDDQPQLKSMRGDIKGLERDYTANQGRLRGSYLQYCQECSQKYQALLSERLALIKSSVPDYQRLDQLYATELKFQADMQSAYSGGGMAAGSQKQPLRWIGYEQALRDMQEYLKVSTAYTRCEQGGGRYSSDQSTEQDSAGSQSGGKPRSGQDETKNKSEKSAAEKVLENPVKGLKKIFGF